MTGLVRFRGRPKLNAPNLLAAWPGIGDVATIVANYLKRKLDFKELGTVEASHFFDPVGVVVKNNLVEAPRFPQSVFYYWKNGSGGNDLILFLGEDQPAAKAYELANCILDTGLKFDARRVYTCAAAMTRIHHTESSRVWGVATSPPALEYLKGHLPEPAGNLHISGLNGLLLGVAKQRGIEGFCLLGEVPLYASRIPNPSAALAVTRELVKVLGIEIDLTELNMMALESRERIKQMAARAMEEYINLYTEPIWESGEEGGGEEEDDEEEEN